ncbi:MAG: single-stranded-DNA-specific exonuclease RecJ [Verrucomicrobia bacterium GWF2_51_19]|nr:MAG: single-stranded-DNA-specific exonuclease RecJ [Verrucomicrobia bacterium GWF2_51_19]HCJ12152.1 single-stranded-DNA-specific exonuclease RecJ [Opitutae bacterium]
MKWKEKSVDRDTVEILAESLGLEPSWVEILVKRDVATQEEAERFLYPKLSYLNDPFELQNVDKIVRRLLRAIDNREKLLILGDYDVDGLTSTTLMILLLRRFGLDPDIIVPRRLDEGYGLSQEVIERSLKEKEKPNLFIVLDCGTNSLEEVQWLASQNIDVIIIDHHRSKESLPENCLLLNPHTHDNDPHYAKQFCTVGLVFKVMHALVKMLRETEHPEAFSIKMRNYLDLVAMGTVADLVPLRDENRILARFGLEQIPESDLPGVQALCRVSGVEGNSVTPADVSFKLAPRINASGRLADALLPLKMLISSSYKEAFAIAGELNKMNKERQLIERDMAREAEQTVLKDQANAAAIIVYNPEWHPGVVGIVAGRLMRDFNRTAIVLGGEGELAKGSGRSIEGVNLVEVMGQCKELLESWGGHPMAAGISLLAKNVDAFREKFNAIVQEKIQQGLPLPELEITQWIEPHNINRNFMHFLDLLQPFGMENPEPIFGIRNVRIKHSPDFFGENNAHVRFLLSTCDTNAVSVVGWNMSDRPPPAYTAIDIAFKLVWNRWNNREEIQVQLIDWL